MLNFLGLAIPWWGRWLAIAGVLVAAAGWGAVKMHEHDEEKLEAFKLEIARAGDKQNRETAERVLRWKNLKEISDAQAQTAAAARDAALDRERVRQLADSSRRIVPAATAGAGGGDRLCLSRDELDRRLRASFARLSERLIGIAEQGQRGIDVAAVCSSWARGLQKGN